MSAAHPIYLDHAATTPVDPRVVAAMQECLGLEGTFGNPSSVLHAPGRAAARRVAEARAAVAALIGAVPEEIVFTSGATEADNLALLGLMRPNRDRGRHLVSFRTEHKAVLDPLRELEREGFEITWLTPDRDGAIDPEAIRAALRADTLLVSVMQVNNETGVLADLAAIGRVCRERGVLLHSDAAQGVGREPIDVRALGVDLLAFSAHKLYGPKGIGALWVGPRARIWLKRSSMGVARSEACAPGPWPRTRSWDSESPANSPQRCSPANASGRGRYASGSGRAAAARRGAPQRPARDHGRRPPQRVDRGGWKERACWRRSAGSPSRAAPPVPRRTPSRPTCCAPSDVAPRSPEFTAPEPRARYHGRRDRPGDRGNPAGGGAAAGRGAGGGRGRRSGDGQAHRGPRRAARGPRSRRIRSIRCRPRCAGCSRPCRAAAGFAEDVGPVVSGSAGSEADGAQLRFELRIAGDTVNDARFQAWGCPHTLAVAAWLNARLPGRRRDALVPGNPESWALELGVPIEKLGRLLLIEDALRECVVRWPVAALR